MGTGRVFGDVFTGPDGNLEAVMSAILGWGIISAAVGWLHSSPTLVNI